MSFSNARRGVLADVVATAPQSAGRPLDAPVREILVIDQGEHLSSPLGRALTQCGFRTTAVTSGCGALAALQCLPIDVVLLDLELPDMDGKELIVRAREFSQAPIIVLSPRKFEEDGVESLDLGANDFLAKPYSLPELLARLRVAVRPKGRMERPDGGQGISFDFEARRVTVAGRERRLTVRETDLLRVLHAAKGAVVSHSALVNGVWGVRSHADLTHLRVLAWQVRRKIEPDAANPQFLLAEPGLGYRLARTSRA